MEARPVVSRADLRRFVELPYHHYRADPVWVPPLRSEQRAQFDPRRNPMLGHCDVALFLLFDGGRAIGRVSAFVDHLAVSVCKRPRTCWSITPTPPKGTASPRVTWN